MIWQWLKVAGNEKSCHKHQLYEMNVMKTKNFFIVAYQIHVKWVSTTINNIHLNTNEQNTALYKWYIKEMDKLMNSIKNLT